MVFKLIDERLELPPCVFCESLPEYEKAKADICISGPTKYHRYKCPLGCMKTKQYLVEPAARNRWISLAGAYKRMIDKAVNTKPPIFQTLNTN